MKRIIHSLLILGIFAAVSMTVFAADSSLTTFEVKYELFMSDDGTLLFSEEPTEILNGSQYYGNKAYVFPLNTKVAQELNGELIPIYMTSETVFKQGYSFQLATEAVESVLNGLMAGDENGVRICSTNMGRGLLTVMIDGVELPNFTVKTEIPIFDGSILLFSEKPVRAQWNIGEFPYDTSFVFPKGTKVAQKLNGIWMPIYVVGEYDVVNRNPDWKMSDPVHELILSEEMGEEPYGIRICSSYFGRGLLPVLIDGVSERAVNPGDSLISMREMEVYSKKPTDEESLAYLRKPSRQIQSDDPDIIALADTITSGISSEYEKARAIHDWVAENIWYDYGLRTGASTNELIFENGEERWYSTFVLRNKRAICGGYANLNAALLRAVGISTKNISGQAGEAHEWNEAFVDGRWINIDTTWDTNNFYEDGQPLPQQACGNKYFDISDAEIAETHTVFYYADYIIANQLAQVETDHESNVSPEDVDTTSTTEEIQDDTSDSNMAVIIVVIVAAALVIIGAVVVIIKKKK